jgi:hypothetical protein
MSERKPTPDVLAELLVSGAAPVEPRTVAERAPRSAAPRGSAPTRAAQTPRAAEKSRGWEYLIVSCQEYRGWRPRFEGGVELADWAHGPLLPNYLKEQGERGWELVAACSGRAMFGVTDSYQLFFKRPSG